MQFMQTSLHPAPPADNESHQWAPFAIMQVLLYVHLTLLHCYQEEISKTKGQAEV